MEQYKKSGSQIILATAAHHSLAQKVLECFPHFDGCLASATTNLEGKNKLEAIKEHTKGQTFDYIGNGHIDLAILHASENAYVVGKKSVLHKLHRHPSTSFVLNPQNRLSAFLQALRPKQWAKNVLIFIPLIAGHDFSMESFAKAAMGFVCFSFLASAIYILNDLYDWEDDAKHPKKRHRPLAAGHLTMPAAFLFAFLLAGISLLMSLFLHGDGISILFTYLCLTILYSSSLKQHPLIDVLTLYHFE